MPLNPGMIGWSVDIGQPEIFSLLDCEEIDVSLTDSYMMVPTNQFRWSSELVKSYRPQEHLVIL